MVSNRQIERRIRAGPIGQQYNLPLHLLYVIWEHVERAQEMARRARSVLYRQLTTYNILFWWIENSLPFDRGQELLEELDTATFDKWASYSDTRPAWVRIVLPTRPRHLRIIGSDSDSD